MKSIPYQIKEITIDYTEIKKLINIADLYNDGDKFETFGQNLCNDCETDYNLKVTVSFDKDDKTINVNVEFEFYHHGTLVEVDSDFMKLEDELESELLPGFIERLKSAEANKDLENDLR